jgi:threonine dehydrogenase-like Zn-dependent dehydrogenase
MGEDVTRLSLWFEREGKVALRREPIPSPGVGEVLIKTIVSAISPGTEMVIYRGEAPRTLAADTVIPSLQGNFMYPLKYGYSAVGKVIGIGPGVDEDWIGKKVFSFHPHESHFVERVGQFHELPSDMSPEQAVFLPNMETALTLTLDGSPLPGEQVVVFGQGIVGLLLTSILSRVPLLITATVDRYPLRRNFSEMVGAGLTLDPEDSRFSARLSESFIGSGYYNGADLAYEISGNPAALATAIDVTGYNGRIVLGSWYGTKRADLYLGGDFHRKRIHLITSQVSTISPCLTGRFGKLRLLALAWEMIRQVKPSRFITHRFPVTRAEEAYQFLHTRPGESIQVLITYKEG